MGTQMTHGKQVNKALRESSSQPRTARPNTACVVLSVVIGQPALGDVSEAICACPCMWSNGATVLPTHTPFASLWSLRPSRHRTEHGNIVGVWKIPPNVTVIQTGRMFSIKTTIDTGYQTVNDQKLCALRLPSPHKAGRMS